MLIMFLLSSCSVEEDPLNAFNSGDYKTSLKLWMLEVETGDSSAQNYLGIQYYLDLGIERNIKQAFYWYEKTAKAGNPEAQRNLGTLYELETWAIVILKMPIYGYTRHINRGMGKQLKHWILSLVN